MVKPIVEHAYASSVWDPSITATKLKPSNTHVHTHTHVQKHIYTFLHIATYINTTHVYVHTHITHTHT